MVMGKKFPITINKLMKLYEIFTVLTRASYWVTDKGEVIKSPNPEQIWHDNEAKKYFPNERDALGEALRHGWIRINAAGHFFDIQLDFSRCSKLAINQVVELVKDIDIDITYHLEGNNDGIYKKFTSQRSTIRFLNQLKIQRINEIEDTLYYHGTNNYPFDKFDNLYTGGIGFHFTKKIEQAKSHGKVVIIAKLDLGNVSPINVWKDALDKASGGNPRRMAINTLRELGYNSVQTPYETIVFEPNQIQIVGTIPNT